MQPTSFGLAPRGGSAPPWRTAKKFNHDAPLSRASLRGRVVVLHAFQMLCPGCAQHGLPQAQRIQASFAAAEVAVIGLHTVFDHHAAMAPVSLRAFLHEYRVSFPAAVAAPAAGPHDSIPQTMRAYGLQGTPGLLLIDRYGDLRLHAFSAIDDLVVGAAIAALVMGRWCHGRTRPSATTVPTLRRRFPMWRERRHAVRMHDAGAGRHPLAALRQRYSGCLCLACLHKLGAGSAPAFAPHRG